MSAKTPRDNAAKRSLVANQFFLLEIAQSKHAWSVECARTSVAGKVHAQLA